MIEYVTHEFDQLLFCLVVKPLFFFASKNRQHIVVLLAVFKLLHQTHRIAFDNLPCTQEGFRKDETVHAESVVSRSVEDESVRAADTPVKLEPLP